MSRKSAETPKTPVKSAKTAKARPKAKAAVAVETHHSIEEQTRAFLQGGGNIEEIPRGVSGHYGLRSLRHITISSKPKPTS